MLHLIIKLREKSILLLIFALILQSSAAFSQESDSTQSNEDRTSAFDVRYEPQRPRNIILPPLLSLFLPGLDQYIEGQPLYGVTYTGVALTGYLLASDGSGNTPKMDTLDNKERLRLLGYQLAFEAGEFSAYHSFRTAVRTRQHQGDFAFLKHEETPVDLLLSPVSFKYITRPTTYLGIPGMLLASIFIESVIKGNSGFSNEKETKWRGLTPSDYAYATAFSFNAGTGEEALFRGWMMPSTMHYTGNRWVSNGITSAVFGAIHYSDDNKFPLSQAVGGFYLGWVAQQNEWAIGESIFIHAWYDVVAFLLTYATADPQSKAKAVFAITPVSIPF